MGRNTRDLFQKIGTLKGYKNRYAKKMAKSPSEWTQSNGCLMRASPLATLPDSEYLDAADADCMLTNPHPTCRDAVRVYVTLLKNLLKGNTKENAIGAAIESCNTPDVKGAIDSGLLRAERDITVNGGWVLHAIYCVFYSMARDYSSFSDAINDIILLGGDTDTNGCIAGAAIGAHFGFCNMMRSGDTSSNIEIMIGCDVTKGGFPRPEEYTFKRLNEIITELQTTN
jgi:ADP-ribosylglycohydrolase